MVGGLSMLIGLKSSATNIAFFFYLSVLASQDLINIHKFNGSSLYLESTQHSHSLRSGHKEGIMISEPPLRLSLKLYNATLEARTLK